MCEQANIMYEINIVFDMWNKLDNNSTSKSSLEAAYAPAKSSRPSSIPTASP